jgi:hypothetical protein
MPDGFPAEAYRLPAAVARELTRGQRRPRGDPRRADRLGRDDLFRLRLDDRDG